jgi:hypothetical protein
MLVNSVLYDTTRHLEPVGIGLALRRKHELVFRVPSVGLEPTLDGF